MCNKSASTSPEWFTDPKQRQEVEQEWLRGRPLYSEPPAGNTPEMALAGLIVGSLICAGVLQINSDAALAGEDLSDAIRVVNACLRRTIHLKDFPDLPFDW